MKKLLFLGCMVLLAGAIMAAAPTNNSTTSTVSAITIDSSEATSAWQAVDSMEVTITDTATVYYTYSLITTLYPGQQLYIKMYTLGDTVKTADTIAYPEDFDGPFRVKLGNTYSWTYYSQTDRTDSAYIRAACGGTTEYENVVCSLVYFSGTVVDYDAP